MYKQIHDGLIIETLSNYRDMSAQITSMIEQILLNLSSDEELMVVASMPGKTNDGDGDAGKFYDLSDVYEDFIKLKEKQAVEARLQIRELIERQETLNRIMAYFCVLPIEAQEVLDYLYVANDCSKEGRIKNPKENGYRSLHLIVSVPIYLKEEKRDMKVEVQLRTIAINLIVSVKDSGIGISEKDIEKLFDGFKRVDLKRNRSIEGTGLGLSIIEGLIKQMGGKIDVSSELGKGSVFTVTILQMVSANQIDENNEENAKDQEHKVEKESKIIAPTAKILVVDDVLINRVIVTKLLTPMQLQFDTAENGEQALELCYKTKYDLILMDHMMPVMDGIEVFNTLREKNNITIRPQIIRCCSNCLYSRLFII